MSQQTDAEYLTRPLIEGVVYTIEADHVSIASPTTLWVNERRIAPLDKGTMLALYSKIHKAAKSQNVKISYSRHMRRQITERWVVYETAAQVAGETFDRIVKLAESVRERGIHIACCDDQTLDKLTTACNKHMEFHWRTSIVSQMSAIARELRDLDRNLSSANHCLYKIHI
jgi:hypothetical protein